MDPSLVPAWRVGGFAGHAPIRNWPVTRMMVVVIDAVAACVALVLGVLWSVHQHLRVSAGWATLVVPLTVIITAALSRYRHRLSRRFLDEVVSVSTSVALASMITLTVMLANDVPGRPGAVMSKIWICAAILMPLARLSNIALRRWVLRRSERFFAPTLIVGNGQVAQQVAERIVRSPEYGLLPVGTLSVDPPWRHAADGPPMNIQWMGSPDCIEDAIRSTGARAMIVAFSRMHDHALAHAVRTAHRHRLQVWVVPRLFDVVGARAHIDHLGGLPILALPYTSPRGWSFTVKHVTDRVIAAAALVVLSPVLVLLAALVRCSSPGPVLFRQQRVGRDGKPFGCLKFRTMTVVEDDDTSFTPTPGIAPGGVEGSDRRTMIGKVLRSTSLDELPQLINVLKGEMSLVGPRPERAEFAELFDVQIRRYGERRRVKAGITGWAQVHGLRGQTSIAERSEWDNYYIENWSMGLDLKILLMTVLAVFHRTD
jgi:exopolysaccharide biosynthesis polyprenyl glycosylphosphotransferase